MKRALDWLTSRWLLTLLGALAIALLVWFLGPLIAIADHRPFERDIVRALIVVAILVGWGLLNILVLARAAARNEKMIEGVAGPKPADAAADNGESEQLRANLEAALRDLRRLRGPARRGAGYLYELPWYVLIGPPGSGKTTALTHSGLSFPLAERFGRNPLRGASGTRNCDWFLTDEAVLLDTAGRYTTQDSDETADRAAWLGFLDLLKQYRPRQPINGALVAISLTDLAMLPETERKAHATAIRARLSELQERFGVRFPVYVLFTKADLIAGFVESFESLTREEREQVWGITFQFEENEDAAPAVDGFDGGLRGLLGRLQERMIERVQQEADVRRRGVVFGFPVQIASLVDPARDFLDEVFRASRYESRPLLRGVYFTSGTQEGTPIDRLMVALVQRFGLQQSRLAAHSGTGRSYFLTRLLRDVVFAEANIVSTNPQIERRRKFASWAVYGSAAILLVVLCAAWGISYAENRALENRLRAAVSLARETTQSLNSPVLQDADPERALPALAALRDLPSGYGEANAPVPLSMRFGLYQGEKLGSQAIAAYERGLNLMLLPRLLARLQNQIRAKLNEPDFVYQALKIYLMLGAQHELDKALIREWMSLDWENAYSSGKGTKAALLAHLDAMLEAPLTAYPLDGDLLEDARKALLHVSPAGRAYAVLKDRAVAAKLAEWRISDHAGPAADRVLNRSSGKRLSDGVPGLYTRAGFYNFVLPNLGEAVKLVEEDSWVLGRPAEQAGVSATAGLDADILKLYYADYVRTWDTLIADVTIVPLRGDQQTAEVLNLLSGPNSALRLLWRAIAEQTSLSRSGDTPSSAPKGSGAGPAPTPGSRVEAVLGAGGSPGQQTYGQPVETHFRQFHETVLGSGSGPAPLEEAINDIGELYRVVNRGVVGAAGAPERGAAARKLEGGSARMPAPIAAMLRDVARKVAGNTAKDARDELDAKWRQNVTLCVNALERRYPMQRGAQADVTPDDFTRLFAPNGLIDKFVSDELRQFVDTRQTPWRPLNPELGGVPIAADALQQFQLASRIRDSFFGSNPVPTVRFEITPLWADSDAKRVALSIDGQEIAYEAGGSSRPTVVQWPGTGNVRQSQITVEGSDGQKATLERSGAWSLLRLLDAGQLDSLGSPDRWRVTFNVGQYRVIYRINAGSVQNPLVTVRDLDRFRCPRGL